MTILFLVLIGCSGNPSVSSNGDHLSDNASSGDGGTSSSAQHPDDGDDMDQPVLNVTVDDADGGANQGAGGDAALQGGAAAQEGCKPVLNGTIRDFVQANMPADKIPSGITPHPDFESVMGQGEKGIVLPLLGEDRKPVYAHPSGTTPLTHGKVAFDQWFHDDPTANQAIDVQLELADLGGGVYSYDNQSFFPINGKLFGNSYDVDADPEIAPVLIKQNFHFTLELHTRFTYSGGEKFTFKGDDDVWVFVNRHLAIDLGGVHNAQEQAIDLDAEAETLELELGKVYDLDFFFAERHLIESTFRIDTTLVVCAPPTNKPPVIVVK